MRYFPAIADAESAELVAEALEGYSRACGCYIKYTTLNEWAKQIRKGLRLQALKKEQAELARKIEELDEKRRYERSGR